MADNTPNHRRYLSNIRLLDELYQKLKSDLQLVQDILEELEDYIMTTQALNDTQNYDKKTNTFS